jgi:hypothetical protein
MNPAKAFPANKAEKSKAVSKTRFIRSLLKVVDCFGFSPVGQANYFRTGLVSPLLHLGPKKSAKK